MPVYQTQDAREVDPLLEPNEATYFTQPGGQVEDVGLRTTVSWSITSGLNLGTYEYSIKRNASNEVIEITAVSKTA